MKMIISINNSRVAGSKESNGFKHYVCIKGAFDISLTANPKDNSSFDHMLTCGSNIDTCKE